MSDLNLLGFTVSRPAVVPLVITLKTSGTWRRPRKRDPVNQTGAAPGYKIDFAISGISFRHHGTDRPSLSRSRSPFRSAVTRYYDQPPDQHHRRDADAGCTFRRWSTGRRDQKLHCMHPGRQSYVVGRTPVAPTNLKTLPAGVAGSVRRSVQGRREPHGTQNSAPRESAKRGLMSPESREEKDKRR